MYSIASCKLATADSVQLFGEPFRQPLLYLGVAHDATRVRIVQSLLNLLPYVDVVLDIFERRVLWKHSQDLLDLFFRSVHARMVNPLGDRDDRTDAASVRA